MLAEKNRQCIGIFDSGVGGLSVLGHIHRRLPNENLCYFADSAYMPYGNKSPMEIEARSLRIAEFLLSRGAKALVVACNTATAAAVQVLRETVNVPVIGMEPAIKPAVHGSVAGVVGVLATSGTISSDKFNRLMQRFTEHAALVVQPCPGLVEHIEAGELDSPQIREMLGQYLKPLLDKGADTVVLGCTHYPFVLPLIREMVGNDIQIIDTGAAIAREVERQLDQRGLLASGDAAEDICFFTSGSASSGLPVMRKLWGSDLVLEACSL